MNENPCQNNVIVSVHAQNPQCTCTRTQLHAPSMGRWMQNGAVNKRLSIITISPLADGTAHLCNDSSDIDFVKIKRQKPFNEINGRTWPVNRVRLFSSSSSTKQMSSVNYFNRINLSMLTVLFSAEKRKIEIKFFTWIFHVEISLRIRANGQAKWFSKGKDCGWSIQWLFLSPFQPVRTTKNIPIIKFRQ